MRWLRLPLLVGIALGIAAGVVAQRSSDEKLSPLLGRDVKFSHRFHLTEVKAVCEDCHAGVAHSRNAADKNVPSEQTCLHCHDGSRARKECTVCHFDPVSARPVFASARDFRFNHQQHLELGNVAPAIAATIDSGKYLDTAMPAGLREQLDTENACVACHRGLEQTDLSTRANLPHMADCLVCHAEIKPPFSCDFCHTKEAKLKPATHTPDFVDLHSSKNMELDKQSCRICHGTRFRCMGCH